jgi:HAMP domain-containing protein
MAPMKPYLQTRVARRVFGLFLVCAVVPAVTLAASGYWLVTHELRSQAGVQLSLASKISGTLLLARLYAADEDVAVIRRAILNGTSVATAPAQMTHLRRAIVVRPGRPLEVLWGEAKHPLPPLSAAAIRHLRRGRSAVVVDDDSARSRVYLVRNIEPGDSGEARLWAQLSSDFLWGDRGSESITPAGVDLCVYTAANRVPLRCSSGAIRPTADTGFWRQGMTSQILRGANESLVTGTSSVFLGFEFGAAPWTVVLEQPLVSIAATGDFTRTVLLTLVTGLALVVFASNVLLRQRLDPIARLQDGTRRLADGDFEARVQVTTGDELQELASSFNSMAVELRDQFEQLQGMSWATLETLARTIDANSPWTAGHSDRVTRLSMAIGLQMALGKDDIDRLHRGGLLHDVGKIGVPSAILDKPAALTPEELALVREHPAVGARILEPIRAFADVMGIVRHHHERYDGAGYPDRLAGERIPLLARVAAVADVYDALVSDRPYRSGWSSERAVEYIAKSSGTHFDPTVVTAFLQMTRTPEWAEATAPGAGVEPRILEQTGAGAA